MAQKVSNTLGLRQMQKNQDNKYKNQQNLILAKPIMNLGKSIIQQSSLYPDEGPAKPINWEYSEDPYGESAKAINIAQQTITRRDDRFIEKQNKFSKSIINKARAINQYANQITFDRNKNGEQNIYENWPMQQDKYIDIDCESQNSEDNQVNIDFPCCDDIMAIIDTEKQQGRIYFIAKIKLPKDEDFSIALQRVRGGGLDVEIVETLQRKDSYFLFKISMTSQIKIFKILLMKKGQKILESKPYNFSIERIEYDVGIAYDFTETKIQNQRLSMSTFEGLLAASSFNVIDQIDFFERSFNKFEEKSKSYLDGKIEIDSIFEKFVLNQKNPEKLLIQFQAILKSPQSEDEKLNFFRNSVIMKISNYFIRFMVNYELKIDESKKITANMSYKLIETYLEIISVEMITDKKLGLIEDDLRSEAEKKVPIYLEFLIQQRRFETVVRYVDIEIMKKFNFLHQNKGLGTFLDIIEESVEAFDRTYVDLCLMFIYYFMSFTDMSQSQLISALVKTFENKKFVWNLVDENDRFAIENQSQIIIDENLITSYQIQIAEKISIPAKSYELFDRFYKVIASNKQHDYLKSLFQNEKLQKTVQNFIESMARQIPDILESALMQKSTKIFVEMLLYEPEKNFSRTSNVLPGVVRKLVHSSSYSRNVSLKQKCSMVHSLILNPLLKSGNQALIETIKTILADFRQALRMRFCFKQLTDLINESFDPAILSNLIFQDIYTNNFLKEVYNLHFVRENASDIERGRSDYANWHNNFLYKPFVNAFLVENVAKLLTSNQRETRRKKQIIEDLRNLIDRGSCPPYEKQTLKTIVEIDNFDLDESVFLQVLTKSRDKLFIIKKIKDEGQQQQKFALESIISQIKRKALTEELPAKKYFEINLASRVEKNMMEKIFAPEQFIDIIEEKVRACNQTFEKLTKYRNFIECLNKKYVLTDYQTVFDNLKDSYQKTKQNKFSHIKGIEFYLNKVDPRILKCYSFSSFFNGQTAKNITLDAAIERCNQLQKRMAQNRNKVICQYQKNQLTYESVNFFKQQLSRQRQLLDLFMMQINENEENIADPGMIKELVKIFSLLKKIPNIINYIKGLVFYIDIDKSGKFKELSVSLKSFLRYLNQISNSVPGTNISQLYHEYEKANKSISCFRFSKSSPETLNLQEQKSVDLLQFLYQMSMVKEKEISDLLSIKNELGNMQEKCDEEQDDYQVDYDDLQVAQLLIKYIQNIYHSDKHQIRALISSTVKLIAEHSRLKTSYQVFGKLQNLLYEFKHVHEGDKKMVEKIQQILRKCIVNITFNQKNILSIQLLNPDFTNKQKRVLISEDQIRKFKGQAVLYIIQVRQKNKTQQEAKKALNYDNFLTLLKSIDQIKEVWKELLEWGYIIFRIAQSGDAQASLLTGNLDFSQSEEDRQFLIENNNHKHLNQYILERKAIAEQWIKQIRQLHTISPKATLLQGQSLKNMYQLLTGFSTQKIANFLNICNPEQIQEFAQKKKYKFKKDPRIAINIIKEFFQFIASQVQQVRPSVMDYSECYIKRKLFNEKENDFIKGIIELDPERIKNLDMTKMLICVDGTTRVDIKTFIQSAINDQKSEYVIIRPEKLTNKDQQYIIDEIESYKKKNKKMAIKLCLVSNSSIQTLYQYLVNNLPQGNRFIESNVNERQKAYLQFILQKTNNLKIVTSSCPGYGKTSWIIQNSKCSQDKTDKNQRKCFFLPISGAPSSDSIYSRFEKITRQIYKRAKNEPNPNKKLSSLIIQIHNVDPKHFEIVNTFLQQIVTGQCVRYNGKFPQLIKNTKIYIQIENIQSVDEYDPLKTFTFLKEILKVLQEAGKDIVKRIEERPPIDFNKFDFKKIEYIIQHLDFFDKNVGGVNLLDRDQGNQNIQRFDQFQPKRFDEGRAKQLFKKYFFDSIPKATFYQFQYFCRLLFDGCKAFSSSMGLSFTCLNESYDGFYKKLLGLETMRSKFFQIILKNCIQFIQREVEYEEFQYKGKTGAIQQKLSSIPFLIIPNKDGQSFSFIYKDHTQVPVPIRNFYISQNTELVSRIGNGNQQNLKKLFEEHSIKKLQTTDPKKFDAKISEILYNISGNKNYSIQKDPNYSVNIDNFFKMCLITLRQRQNIPIIIMGEAGTGKTALLKHVSEKLYESEFLTLNINAGTKVDDLRAFLKRVRTQHEQLAGKNKKLWIFFDEFNTLKEVGYIKEIMIDKRFEGQQLDFLHDIVIMAACNPFRRLKSSKNDNMEQINQSKQQGEVKKSNEPLAFHVLPPPHSMIQSMWNYGALSPYQYEKYISKMIANVDYKITETTKLLLEVHKYLEKQFDSSFVSLRDIERFRTLYAFFSENLPKQPHPKTKDIIYPGYNNYVQKALLLSFVFCYTLRIQFDHIKNHIYSTIEKALNLNPGHIKLVKFIQQTDFYNRLKIDYASIASNSAIKQNCYAFFVAVYNRLPMIIVGPPGCSKSLAIRILTQNMKGISVEDRYLKKFQAMRSITFQGSELCTSKQVEALFEKAMNPNKNKHKNYNDKEIKEVDEKSKVKQMKQPDEIKEASLVVVVFDQIGLADKSKDNPLKVIHPYLEVSKELNLAKQSKSNSRNYSFLGISNTILDLSKMSRMLVLKRPQPSTQELKETAVGIGRSFEYGKNQKISMMVENISEAFFSFVDEWHKAKRFTNFYSLRDFYSLIKYFLGACQQRQVNINDDNELVNLFEQAVFRNLHGMNGSVEIFMRQYRARMGQGGNEASLDSKFSIIENIVNSLEKQSIRFPLVIVEDDQSLSYLINMLMNRFKRRTSYFERSPFLNDKNNNLHVLRTTAQIIKTLGKGDKLILNNIEPTIQTSLYDMLNKFYIVRGDQNYCRISEVESGLTKKTLVNKEFNCICFLLESNLEGVEAPFLSRFEKYVFSLKKMSNAKQIDNIVQEVQIFKKTIMQICREKNMSHYKIENFFQNCERDIIRTLVLRIYNEINNATQDENNAQSIIEQQDNKQRASIEQIILRQVIYEIVMNSTQDFMMIYQYVLSKEPKMQIYSHFIVRAIDKKKTFSIDGSNNVILFTTDTNVVFNGCNNSRAIKSLKLQQIKKQSSFDEMLSGFLHSHDLMYLFVELKTEQLRHIQYLISQIQKVQQQQSISKGKSFQNKKIFILHKLDRKYQNQPNIEARQNHGISFLSQYPQIFYQGNLEIGMLKYDRKDFFHKILDLTHILSHIQDFFTLQIKCKDDQNNGQILASFKRLYNQISIDKNGLFHAHIQQFIEKTEGTNVIINETLVLEVLENPEFLKNCSNFKQALTKQLSSKSFYGVVAFFLKYLFESHNFLTYSKSEIYTLNGIQHFNLIESRKNFIENTKRSAVYENNLKLLMGKKMDYFKAEYQKYKKIKRLPSIERKFNVELTRGRFIHFSKSQNEIILSKSNDSLSDFAKKIYSTSVNLERDLRIFKQELQKKSTFMIKNDGAQKSIENLYSSMNKDPGVKELFIFELLIDFAQQKGLNVKYIEVYMKIIKLLINFDSSNNKKTLDIEYLIYGILAYQQVLTFLFKLFSVFSDNEVAIGITDNFFESYRIKQGKDITQENCSRFVTNLVKNILDPIFTDQKTIAKFRGPKVFFEIFTNSMLQIQNIEKVMRKKQSLSTNLASLRDIARFCSQFDEDHKFQLLEMYIRKMNEKKNEKNVYSVTFNFVQSLNRKQLKPQQKDIVMKFQANKIFLQWFKDRPDDHNCLQFFIHKCESEQNFCHNSMHVINYLLNQKEYDYERIEQVERVMQDPGSQMTQIAKYSKSKGFQNNLCILMVNIFLQKLQKNNDGKTHKQILQEHKNNFVIYYKKLSVNNLDLQLFQIFLFAFIKFVLISYTEVFSEDYFDDQISELLNGDNYLSANARLFCLKILRLYNTPKEIKEKFINITRMVWSKKVEPDFKQSKDKSLIVPRDFCSPQLAAILDEIQSSDGAAFTLFDKMLEHTKSFENRYSILNFFMRFYYSLYYNEKTYKAKTIEYFVAIRTKFELALGKVETSLIERYLNNHLSVHFSVKSSQTVNEQDFIGLNFMNLFLASRGSVSPLHSLFVNNGQIASDIYQLTKDQFSISGPENPFINIAESVVEMTRNNNIGVYICSSECDYIYSHENCGWPSEQTDCPLCGQKIGSKGRSHTLSRDQKGARRLMTKVLVDKSAYYVWSMTTLTEYWQVQRKYILAEINRMKLKKQTSILIKQKKQNIKLTGLCVVNSGRVSSFSYKLLSFYVNSISYLLVSLKIIDNSQIEKLFGFKTDQETLNIFNIQMRKTIEQSKLSLNLGNKYLGWMFGIQRQYIIDMNNFKNKFTQHQLSLLDQMEKLKVKLTQRIQEKKISQDYINLYVDFVKVIEDGYFVKDQCQIKDLTAANRFTRDFSQKLFENHVKVYTGDKKFDFSVQYQSTQGKMQFPFDSVLTQDEIDKEKYNYYRIFKLPDQKIGHHEIVVKYEAIIKEKYPYLDYILKNSDQFYQMKNFEAIITYVNELHKQVNNRYERIKAQEPLSSFIQELKDQQGNGLSKKLKNYPDMLQSWKKLSKFLGVLRNGCKDIGRMNDTYDHSTPFKAFLLDQSTKQNVYGLMIGSLFHNFARMHNESMAVLNSRKNQIKAYNSLNLFNDILKMHPQSIETDQIFTLDDQQLKQNLQACSVASIIYGQNFIFHNFDAYQEYFIKKLEGKCQIISDQNSFINVCYNGEAFSAQNEGSGVLVEIREFLDKKLGNQSLKKVREFIKRSKQSQFFEKTIVQIRGDLEKMMLALNTLKGNYSKDQSCCQIIKQIQIKINSNELKNDQLSEIPICEIYDLYEFLEDELKYQVLKKLPQKYKEKMDNEMASKIEASLRALPSVQSDQSPTIDELESAVMKFISRTLQNGIFSEEKLLLQFLNNRADFWPKDYDENKKESLTYDQTMMSVKIANVFNLIQIINNVKKDSNN